MKGWMVAMCTLGFLVLWAMLSNMDYAEQQLAHDNYCENVREGVWPDFKGTYSRHCSSD